ncbi:hypothetical protein ACVBIL_04835 [Shewanella sp. 125m-7]
MEMKKLTLVICIGAAISGSAFANGEHNGGSNGESDSSVTLTKDVEVTKDVTFKGGALVLGVIKVDGLGMAVVENKQSAGPNWIDNSYVENDASISGSAFNGASGNIGVNQAAGDFNVQANSAALASIDASFAFGAGDAEIFSTQSAMGNYTDNYASTNSASVGGSSFQGASGNIGVNVASGGNNVQANNMAASAHKGSMGEATVLNAQSTGYSKVMNTSVVQNTTESVAVNFALNASGTYSGTSDQNAAYYPEIWKDSDGAHNTPGASIWGHIDMDNQNPTGADGLSFDESGDMALAGTVSGQLPIYIETVTQKTTNTASIGGSAFQNASGNIGVNMASGHGNLQSNNLSLTSMTGGAIVSENP